MAMGGCFPPRPLPFSAAAAEQPQPARLHRSGGTGAPDRAGGTEERTGGELLPFPGQQIASGGIPCMAAVQPPEAGQAGGGECQA